MLTFIFQVELRELLQFCSSQEETDTTDLCCISITLWTSDARTSLSEHLAQVASSFYFCLDTGSGRFSGRKLLRNTSRFLCVHGRGLYQLLQSKRKWVPPPKNPRTPGFISASNSKVMTGKEMLMCSRRWRSSRAWSDVWAEPRDVRRRCLCQASLQNGWRRRQTHIQVQGRP